ncbi:MAG: winged helix-turn-helix domain-containing protein [Anaerolineae bacterium]
MQLSLSFLVPFHVTLNGQPARFAKARARALLAYLAVEVDRPHRRDNLVALLWPDHPETLARQNLRQDLARLRRAIGDEGETPYLETTATTVQFNAACGEVDVAQFGGLVAAYAGHHHMGGMGKTRLVIEVAVTHVELYPAGVYFVPLTPQSEPSSLASAIANALGLTLQGKDVWAERLSVLKHQKALLILVSFEHLLTLPKQGSTQEVEGSAACGVVPVSPSTRPTSPRS